METAATTLSHESAHAARWRLGHSRSLTLDRARVLAVLNVTPDSFSDGGALTTVQDAVEAARKARDAGAAMLDIGGESTRPGASPVNPDEQIRRVAPAIRAIRSDGIDLPISVDTTSAKVAQAALDAGADAINDVSAALDDPMMLPLAASRGAGIILMHRRSTPQRDRFSDRHEQPPDYGNPQAGQGVVNVVHRFLQERIEAATAAGVAPEAIIIDPGLGFGKDVQQHIDLIANTSQLHTLGRPILCAASRKSFIGALTGVDAPHQRVAGSIAICVAMRLAGAMLFRVHDVPPSVEALAIADRLAPTPDASPAC